MATLQHTDELYHILEDEICALKILPGEALSENQLCKRFGVSRTPIRSVLQRLEQNRFVQIIPCKGTIVTAIDIGVVDQLIFQRVAVEGMVFRDFVQSCSPMEILAVEHLYNMLLEAAAGRSDPENFDFNHFLSCDLAMHAYWFRKTSKEYLWEQMTRPQADYSRFIRLDIVGARNVSSVVSEHTEMLRILREKDLDAIEPLMRTHLYGGVSRWAARSTRTNTASTSSCWKAINKGSCTKRFLMPSACALGIFKGILFLSQFSEIVSIKTAYLRYAVCGCCLCIKNANCYKLWFRNACGRF